MDKKDEFLLARVEEACQNNYAPQFFDFQDEAMQMKMEKILKHSGEPYLFWGGTENAGRRMLCIYPDYLEADTLEWPMLAVALMHLGITRECVGDINMNDEEVQVVFAERLRDFITLNFTKVKGRTIKPEILEPDLIKTFELRFKRLELVAASDRLDGVINKIWGFSRQDSITYIKQRRVRVNYEAVTKNDYRIKNGDVISFRGKGKAVITELGGVTKKGNLRLIVDKYI